ncbi:hypothetical protein PYW07_003779 [Mythimna separata]|uniref:C-type lectin domain-containing protein n=1 Tax=Mythimna separata TaxID=271217 RepID=A0AAD7YPS9_MYTSE|nr:hypothetical protein PYW07_003779 [Mythimna separata]
MCSKSLSVFLLMCLLSDFSYGQTNDTNLNDYGYVPIEALGLYKFHAVPTKWREAKRVCDTEEARLFYPENSIEANAVISFWKPKQITSQPDDTWVYVGISDISTEGIYETIDGRKISEVYNKWKPAQPDNSNNVEDCIHLNQIGLYNDINCEYQYGFICKKNLPPPKENNDCKTKQANRSFTDEKIFRKDYTYIGSEESFYKIHTVERTFTDAKRMCVLEGATLYYAENVKEVNAVAAFWNRTQPGIPSVFVGLTDLMAEGLFETVDGRPIFEVYNKWQSSQPDNFNYNEDCVQMDLAGTMRDCKCDSQANFICKKSLQSLTWNQNCNMPNLDYTYNKDIGKCYKLHTTPMNWTDAYAMCRTELTSLAIISNRMEAEYLGRLTKSTPKPRVSGKYQKGLYHVGFHNRFNEGWQTVAGTPMNVDAELWFDGNQPDENNYEECISMFFNGLLINTSCNMKSLFICEQNIIPTSNSTSDLSEENYMLL